MRAAATGTGIILMNARALLSWFVVTTVFLPAVSAAPAEKGAPAPKKQESAGRKETQKSPASPSKSERATFGGGCFWSMEAVFERIPGVRSVTSGFAGGSVPSPSYEMVCTGQTGHAEVIQVEFDPAVVSYEKLLKVFWSVHDPTTPNAQGDDFGPQYRSIILFHNEAQKKAALKSYDDLTNRRVFRAPIVTELVPMERFYPAEAYHQDYYRHHRSNDYSLIYIDPKLRKLRQKGILPARGR